MRGAPFEQLVHEWYDRLFRFALSLTHNSDDALDLTQQTFARWAEKGHTLRDKRRAKTWLFTVLYREFVAKWRVRRRIVEDPEGAMLEHVVADTTSPRQTADARAAVAALSSLEGIFREPLTLFYLQDHSYREIAEILDLPIGTVMSRLARGREHLREKLEHGRGADEKIILLPALEKGRHHG